MVNKLIKHFVFLYVFGVVGINASYAQQWDWHIAGGTIIDGAGVKLYQADLLIR